MQTERQLVSNKAAPNEKSESPFMYSEREEASQRQQQTNKIDLYPTTYALA